MSAAGRGSPRMADDFYATPAWAVRAILPHLAPWKSALDPCAGKGAILDVLRQHRPGAGHSVFGIELDPERAAVSRSTCADALLPTNSWAPAPDLIITNPPFELAMQFVSRSLFEVSRCGEIAMLLRLPWLCSATRRPFHRAHPSDVFPLPERPSFAASLKCARKAGGPCGWKALLELDAPRPSVCPDCGGKVSVITTDSTDYAWFCWGPNRGNRWFLLDKIDDVTPARGQLALLGGSS